MGMAVKNYSGTNIVDSVRMKTPQHVVFAFGGVEMQIIFINLKSTSGKTRPLRESPGV